MKNLLRICLFSPLLLLPNLAHAALTTLEGEHVLYQVNLDAPWMSNLQAQVSGNTLQFVRKDNSAIISSTQIDYGSDFQAFDSQLGDVKVQAKDGFKLEQARISNSGHLEVAGEDNRSANISSWFWSYAFFSHPIGNELGVAEKHTALIASNLLDNPNSELRPVIGKPRLTDDPMTSFSALSASAMYDIQFFNEVNSWVLGREAPKGYAYSELNSFGISMQVAPVPEPETYALMGIGVLGLIAARRKRVTA